MRVVHLSSEVSPWAKTGGLGDVLAALPRAQRDQGIDVAVCTAGHAGLASVLEPATTGDTLWVPVASRTEPAQLRRITAADVPIYVVWSDRYFARRGLYGDGHRDYADNAERFVFFCRAVLEWLRSAPNPPDVLHAHDWQAALALAFLACGRELYPELARTRTVLTIHNLAYQGRFWAADWDLLNLDASLFSPEAFEFHGDINFLKAGIVCADAITTVSPTYAREIQTPALGEGLDGVLRVRRAAVTGILNGVDDAVWDPAADPLIAARYDAHDLVGKGRCKLALQAELGLSGRTGTPLAAVVSRLAEQKGIGLLVEAIPRWLSAGQLQLAVLGSGDARYEAALAALAREHPTRLAVRLGFDDALAHRLEAGADLFLMPSRFEPCGLSQLYSLRYGTVPVVHATGGLADTIVDADAHPAAGTGFAFAPHALENFREAVARARRAYDTPDRWNRIVARGMAADFSWAHAAAAYLRLYAALLGRQLRPFTPLPPP